MNADRAIWDFNPRSPWGGSDPRRHRDGRQQVLISIHAPRGGSDGRVYFQMLAHDIFQPTLPVGERPSWTCHSPGQPYFNPRSPWGGATAHPVRHRGPGEISIHAPRGGSDDHEHLHLERKGDFNPRSPWGERPCAAASRAAAVVHFNPRSPWGERLFGSWGGQMKDYFNPRSPWGERPRPKLARIPGSKFQSTLPVGGATSTRATQSTKSIFQSTLPVGGATVAAVSLMS